jgi:hypothetical protein
MPGHFVEKIQKNIPRISKNTGNIFGLYAVFSEYQEKPD